MAVEQFKRVVTLEDRGTLERIAPQMMRDVISRPRFQVALHKFANYTLNKRKECSLHAHFHPPHLGIRIIYGTEYDTKEQYSEDLGSVEGIGIFDTHSHPGSKLPIFSEGDLEAALSTCEDSVKSMHGVSIVRTDHSILTLMWLPVNKFDPKELAERLDNHILFDKNGEVIAGKRSKIIAELRPYGKADFIDFQYKARVYVPNEKSQKSLEKFISIMKCT